MTNYEKPVEALRCCIQNPPETCVGCTYNTDVGCNVARMMSDAADAIEALQAQSPKLGKWVREMNVYDEPFYHCSACGECFDSNRDDTYGIFNYCPNCGAKMEVQDG